jgi:hypothetical protein
MLHRIFKYDLRLSRVVRIISKNEVFHSVLPKRLSADRAVQYRAEVWSLASEEDWYKWFHKVRNVKQTDATTEMLSCEKYSNQSDLGLILM